MNRTDRLVAIVMFLQGRRLVRAEELASHFEVSVRTIYRDVAALSEAGVPVSGEAGVGYTLMKGYHLPPVMFAAEEAMALFVGGEMVKHFTDASLAEPMRNALLKIRSVLPRDRQDDVDRLAASTAIHSTGNDPESPDQRVLLPIQHAIVGRWVLRLDYHGAGRPASSLRDVEPLGVTFYQGAWYLVAWCRVRADLRQFKLERIRRLELLGERFAPRPDFSLPRYLEENHAEAGLLASRIRLSHRAAERARRESFIGLQEEERDEASVTATIRTFSYTWLAHWLLSYGGEAEALEPEALRTEVRLLAQKALSRHAGVEIRETLLT
jgi:predicted DNA-binding transcriptional regulator YafY